jgi:peptidoglycan/LPS O-acetylase OafA/YrhL
VVAYFVVSGFVLACSLDANFSVGRFLRAGIFRLFPAAITTVLIFTAVFYPIGFNLYHDASYGPLNILANILMLHVYIDVAMWSMRAELAATPLIILCAWLCRRYGARPVSAIAFVAVQPAIRPIQSAPRSGECPDSRLDPCPISV